MGEDVDNTTWMEGLCFFLEGWVWVWRELSVQYEPHSRRDLDFELDCNC